MSLITLCFIYFNWYIGNRNCWSIAVQKRGIKRPKQPCHDGGSAEAVKTKKRKVNASSKEEGTYYCKKFFHLLR